MIELAGRDVGRVGFGAMRLSTPAGLDVAPDVAADVLTAAVDRGARLIDTAEFYGRGAVNAAIRDTLRPRYPELVVATKIGARHDATTGLRPAQRPDEIRADVEANLASLGTERLDLVYLRRTDMPPGIIATGAQVVDLDSQLAELSALRDEGKIGAIGLSNVSVEQLDRALPAGIAAVQNAYSLADRSAEPVLDRCRAHRIAWIPYWPLGGTFAGTPKVADQPAVRSVATRLGVTPAQLGLAWLLAHYERTAIIPGTRDPAHLDANMAVAKLDVPADLLRELAAR
ncbi:MAG TPA: aldo/keto reductase [Pseudonocardiaceae bacterium]|nr:aldo/keto reductase [Pseudonocardiaceae bacterium]